MQNKIGKTAGVLFNWVLPISVIAGACLVVYSLGSKPRVKRKKAPPRLAVPVEIVQPKLHDGPLSISASGVVVPFREIELAAEVSGRISWKSDRLLAGTFVSKGDPLLKIAAIDYELEVTRLEQQVEKAKSELLSIDVDIQNANRLIELGKKSVDVRNRQLERLRQLKRNQATSDAEFDTATKSFLDAKQLLTSQENMLRGLEANRISSAASMKLAKVELEKANLSLKRTTIVAPIDGVVISQSAEENSYVRSGDTVVTIEDTSQVEVRCSLRKQDLEFLPAQTSTTESPANAYRLPPVSATIHHTRAGKSYRWKGVLSRQDGLGMDQQTRTMPVRILIADPLASESDSEPAGQSIALVRGMFVKIELHCQRTQPLLTIPEDTIRAGKKVWLVVDDRLSILPIHIARIEDSIAYVDPDGELTVEHDIISSPVPGAKEGLVVETPGTTSPRKKVANATPVGPSR